MSALELRTVLAVPHTDLKLSDGRRLRRWQDDDPRRRRAWSAGMLDLDGWSGPQQLIVVCSLDRTQHGDLLHVSLSYQHRDPSWRDITLVQALFFGADTDAMLPLPREEDYVHGVPGAPGRDGGLDSHVFQVVQMPTGWGMR